VLYHIGKVVDMKKKFSPDPRYEKVLPEDEAEKFRAEYEEGRTHCICGEELKNEPILYYVPPILYYVPHEDGWTIKNEWQKVWLYIKCPQCGYDCSIWKLGVPRE